MGSGIGFSTTMLIRVSKMFLRSNTVSHKLFELRDLWEPTFLFAGPDQFLVHTNLDGAAKRLASRLVSAACV